MLSILCVILPIKVKVGIPESFKVGWYPPKKTGSSHLKVSCESDLKSGSSFSCLEKNMSDLRINLTI